MSETSEKNLRLLAVDDDPLIIASYRRLFTSPDEVQNRTQFELDCFAQGEEAVAAVQRSVDEGKLYSVALIDMRMPPGIGGLETASAVRKLDREIQIIFVTAYSDHGIDLIASTVDGPVLWFRKPFEREELYQVVRNCNVSWNQGHELQQLKNSLSDRVDVQTKRLRELLRTSSMVLESGLEREEWIRELKRENFLLNAQQELCLLLSAAPLKEPISSFVDDNGWRPTVLLVDESSEQRANYVEQLKRIGFKVVVAGSIRTGLEEARKAKPEITLIGQQLSDGSGEELIALLKASSQIEKTIPLFFANRSVREKQVGAVVDPLYPVFKDEPMEQFVHKMSLVRDYLCRHHDHDSELPQGHKEQFPEVEEVNRKVLFVDDEQNNLDFARSLLDAAVNFDQDFALLEQLGLEESEQAESGYAVEVSTALQGEEAIEMVVEAEKSGAPFAMAFIDIQMPPGIDGLETARQILQIAPEIEIVILTAYTDYSLVQMQGILGASFTYMAKPYNKDEMVQRVVDGCSRWEHNQHLKKTHHALLNFAEDMDYEISRRKQVEHDLESASEKLQKSSLQLQREKNYMEEIFFSMREPLIVVDHSAVIRECNTALLKMVEMSRGQLIGKSVDSIFDCDEGRDSGGELMGEIMSLLQGRLQQIHDQNHEAFHLFLHNAPVPIIVADISPGTEQIGNIFLVSRELEKLLGYAPGTLLNTSIFDLLPEVEQDSLRERMGQSTKMLTCLDDKQCHWRHSDGGVVVSTVCMLYIECGDESHVVMQLKTEGAEANEMLLMTPFEAVLAETDNSDFTQQLLPMVYAHLNQKEEQADEALELFCNRAILPMVVVNAEVEICAANSALAELTGWQEGELVGVTIERMLPESIRERHQQMVNRFFQHPELRPMGVGDRLLTILNRNGDEVEVEIGLVPVEAAGQQFVLVIFHDPENRELLELFKSSMLGQLLNLDSERDKVSVDRTLCTLQGRRMPVSVSGSLLHNIHGGVDGVVLMLHDLSERKKLEQREQYAAFQAGVAEMSANILHNVGNTIQGMDAAALDLACRLEDSNKIEQLYTRFNDALESAESAGDSAKVAEAEMSLIAAGRRLPQALHELNLDLNPSLRILQTGVSHIKEVIRAQQKSGKIDTHAIRFSVPHLLEDLRLLTERDIARRNIRLSCTIENGVPEVVLERNQLLQALINLIKNSAESIEEHIAFGGGERGAGRIALRATFDDKRLKLVVEDNGSGIDPEIQKTLLQFGFTTKPDGSGFGLHATGNFVVSNGGTISIESEGVGKGATVTMVLPTQD